jgi:hypothetical protein
MERAGESSMYAAHPSEYRVGGEEEIEPFIHRGAASHLHR